MSDPMSKLPDPRAPAVAAVRRGQAPRGSRGVRAGPAVLRRENVRSTETVLPKVCSFRLPLTIAPGRRDATRPRRGLAAAGTDVLRRLGVGEASADRGGERRDPGEGHGRTPPSREGPLRASARLSERGDLIRNEADQEDQNARYG